MTETELETNSKSYCQYLGGSSFKLQGSGNTGKPDQVFTIKGRVVYIELKNPIYNKPAKVKQIWYRDKLRKQKTPAFITSDWQFVKKILTMLANGEEILELRDKIYDNI